MRPVALDYRIDNLRDAASHRATVADRIWRAWWAPDGRSLAEVDAALAAILATEGFPFSLVAHAEDQFLGTVTAVMDDIPDRPHLGPCLAALWVEPEARGEGIGEAMMVALCSKLKRLGFGKVYLSAKPPMRDFYAQRGWTLIETGVSKDDLDVFQRALP